MSQVCISFNTNRYNTIFDTQISIHQFVLKLIEICYIHICCIQFCINLDTLGSKIQIVVYQFVVKMTAEKNLQSAKIELYIELVFLVSIGQYFLGIYQTDTAGKILGMISRYLQ